MASIEAIERRRANRKARNEMKRLRREREAKIAKRMFQRFYQNGRPVNLILLDYRYWQARRCGWDVMATSIRGKVEPNDCETWQWWTGLHYESRGHFVRISQFRLLRH